jgi:hypothetical protein
MNIKVLRFKLFAILFCSLFITCNFSVDEKERLRDSKAAFQKEKFSDEPFKKADVIARFSDFLIRNCDTLLAYHHHNDYKKFQTSKGYQSFTKRLGECFTFLTESHDVINYYVPEFLIDSIYNYTAEIGEDFIPCFSLCPKKNFLTINGSTGNLVLYLSEERNPHYYIRHFIYTNRKEKVNHDIQNMYETLLKDTVLKDELRYAILVAPDTGL